MLCVPSAKPEVVNEAEPLLTAIAPEIGVFPSRNWTEPIPVTGVSVAVNVTLQPTADGLAPAVKETARLLVAVRKRTGLLRSFFCMNGQSLFAGLKGICVSNTVTMPGIVDPPER